MKKSLIFVAFMLAIFVMPIVAAEISVSQPKGLYSLGDSFNFSVTVAEDSDSNDFLTVDLSCDSKNVEIYRAPLSVKGGSERTIDVDTNLDSSVLGGLEGNCFISASYNGDSVSGRNFEISSEVNVIVDLFGDFVDPGTDVKVSGTAEKENGKNVEGFAELSIPEIDLTRVSNVVEGKFEFDLAVPSDVSAGKYDVEVKVYERDFRDEVTNEGVAESSLQISAILTKVDVAVNTISIVPGEEVLYNVLAYDQGGKEMESEITIELNKPSKELHQTEVVKSGSVQSLETSTNFSHGSWTITASSGELSVTKSFFVQELEKANFVLEGEVLVVENVGNIPYSDPVGVGIGEDREVKDVFVDVGEQKRFRLNAPDGEYDVSVTTTNNSVELGRTFLTGNSVAVKDNDGRKIFGSNLFAWILLIGILGFIGYFYYGKMQTQSLMPVQTSNATSESGDIQSGEKQKSSVVVVKFRNYDSVRNEESAKETMKNVLAQAGKYGAKVMQYPDHVMFVLAPKATKKEENSQDAVELANSINKVFGDHNRMQKVAFEYGIGVNEGDLIVELKEGKLKFSSIGNTVSASKSLAENSDANVVISDSVHSATRAKVKVDRNKEGWAVREIKNPARHGLVERFKDSKQIKKEKVENNKNGKNNSN